MDRTISFDNGRLACIGQEHTRVPSVLCRLLGERVECLDLSYNKLISIQGVESFAMLKELILDNNSLTENIIIPHIPNLTTFSVNKNRIQSLEIFIQKVAASLPKLQYLSMLGNPACPDQLSDSGYDDEDYARYRCYVLHHLPNLIFLDSSKVKPSETVEAKRRGHLLRVAKPLNVRDSDDGSPHSSGILTPLPKSRREIGDHQGQPVLRLVQFCQVYHHWVHWFWGESSLKDGRVMSWVNRTPHACARSMPDLHLSSCPLQFKHTCTQGNMGAKHWAGAIVFLMLAGLTKAHMLFIRLVILAAAGLAGLFLLHILAQDYRKIQSNRPKAFGLFKRSIEDSVLFGSDIDTYYSESHKQFEQAQRDQQVETNHLTLLGAASKLDPQGCARRYVCSLAANTPQSLSSMEKALLDLIDSHKDGADFKAAAHLGRERQSSTECAARYPRCTYSVTEMLRLIQPVY